MRVHFASSPRADATGRDAALWTAVASSGLEGWVRSGSLRWVLGMAVMAPLSPVRATDAGRTVTAIEGGGLLLRFGVRAGWGQP